MSTLYLIDIFLTLLLVLLHLFGPDDIQLCQSYKYMEFDDLMYFPLNHPTKPEQGCFTVSSVFLKRHYVMI